MVFPVVMYRCESWNIKKAEGQRIDAFELWFWRMCPMFKSIKHFEFIFVHSVRVWSNFIDLLSQHHLLRKNILYSCQLCQGLIASRCVALSLGPILLH